MLGYTGDWPCLHLSLCLVLMSEVEAGGHPMWPYTWKQRPSPDQREVRVIFLPIHNHLMHSSPLRWLWFNYIKKALVLEKQEIFVLYRAQKRCRQLWKTGLFFDFIFCHVNISHCPRWFSPIGLVVQPSSRKSFGQRQEVMRKSL